MDKSFEINWTSLWRILGMLILISVFYIALDIWIAVLFAIVLSSAFDPLVSWLEKKRIPRILGTLSIFIALIVIVALILYAIVPIALTELNILLKAVREWDNPAFGLQEIAKVIAEVNENLGKLADILLSGSISFIDTISKFLGGLAIAAAVFVLSFYLTVDRDGVEKFLRAVIPSNYEEKTLEIYFRTRRKIGRWLYGQALLSFSVGFAVFLGLWIIGVKYSLVLGILAGVLELVPYVGPILSGILAILVAFSQSLSAAIYVFILFVIIQQLEGMILTPMFMRFATSLHPAVVLVSLLIGGRLLGFAGVILAVPIAVALQEIVENWSNEKTRRKTAALNGS